MIITVVYFVVGLTGERIICDTLRDPDSDLFELIDKAIESSNFSASTVVKSCHNNDSAYVAFNLERIKDITTIDNLLEEYGINKKIKEFQDKIRFDGTIKIIDEDTKKELDNLVKTGIGSIDLDKFIEVVGRLINSRRTNS